MILGSNPVKIHDFYEKLIASLQSLDTRGKLKEINGYVRLTLDKLPSIGAALVRLDSDWQEWKFGQFAEALWQWTGRNPTSHERKPLDNSKKDRLSALSNMEIKGCVYYNKEDHKSIQCKPVTDTNPRPKILREKKLRFNCTAQKHGARECKSEQTCRICKRKHHTTIFDKDKGLLLTANENKASVTYPVVLIKVDGIINKKYKLLDVTKFILILPTFRLIQQSLSRTRS